MKLVLSVFMLHLEMFWCLFLCHWFKLASRQRVKGLGFFDGKVRDVDAAKLRAGGMDGRCTIVTAVHPARSGVCLLEADGDGTWLVCGHLLVATWSIKVEG